MSPAILPSSAVVLTAAFLPLPSHAATWPADSPGAIVALSSLACLAVAIYLSRGKK